MDMPRTAQLETHVLGSMGMFVWMSNGSLLSRRAGGGGRLKETWFPEGRGSGKVLVNRADFEQGRLDFNSVSGGFRKGETLPRVQLLREWMLEVWLWKEDSGGAACIFFQEPRQGPLKTTWGKFFLAADPQVTASRIPPSPTWAGLWSPPWLLPLHVPPLTEQILPPLSQGTHGQAPCRAAHGGCRLAPGGHPAWALRTEAHPALTPSVPSSPMSAVCSSAIPEHLLCARPWARC